MTWVWTELGKDRHRVSVIVWIISAIVGTATAAANAIDAQTDLAALDASGRNGILRIQAVGSRNDQVVSLAALICDLAASLLLLRGPRPHDDCRSMLDRYGPWFAAAGSVFVTYVSMSQRWRRKWLLDALRLRKRDTKPLSG